MHPFDMRTLVIGYAVMSAVCTAVMYVHWRNNRTGFPGLSYWLAGFIMQSGGMMLLSLRTVMPEIVYILIGNPLLVAATAMILYGMRRYVGLRRSVLPNILLVVLYAALQAVIYALGAQLTVRSMLFAAANLVVCLQCVWVAFGLTPRPLRPFIRGVGLVYLGFALVNTGRLAAEALIPSGEDFFEPHLYTEVGLFVFQILFVLLTFTLLLSVNRRLLVVKEHDLAGQEQAEKVLRLRLKLWEYSADHGARDLMQQALDEIEELTGSRIGFYHLVDESDNTLTLQAWSTRTVQTFCKAEGQGMHYAIDDAGVWVDCVRRRGPVIHNEYASLPHRKGLPPGHAQVVRELVVPTLRDGKIVSILGVGNKPQNYEERDVVLVSYIADLVWSIVTQKKADEIILNLNERLERLAMTDELTGLANRRMFFIRGREEVKRSRRYKTSLALMMLDIDRFKQLNDTHGHDIGDKALRSVATVLKNGVRDTDLVARLGGEEFGVILPSTRIEDAMVLAERLRQSVEESVCCREDKDARVTVSIGVSAANGQPKDIDSLLKIADSAMYQAKLHGRNRVVRAE